MGENKYDIIVVGAGHAGVEAALAGARLGKKTCLITVSLEASAQMSCNPAIGGLAKGHLVRELDALGGEMGLAIDKTGIQFKMLNRSKGRAVWSPRAQADKHRYQHYFAQLLSKTPNLIIIEGHVSKLLIENNVVIGVYVQNGGSLFAKKVVLSNGTFLKGKIHIGDYQILSGRYGELPSQGISDQLLSLGLEVGQLKTGTPPRVHRDTINFNKMKIQRGDKIPEAFSWRSENFNPPDIPCYLTHTNKDAHDLIQNSLHRSPLFSGKIAGVGPRYCPSIEDKVVRFSDKLSHHLFLEPEWENGTQWYINGFSSSLPLDIQLKTIRMVSGLEKVEFLRPAYAIEYDYFPSWQLHNSYESRAIKNLYFSGQINGTSGYEEAAVQGFLAGVNAARSINGKDAIVMARHEAYSGVLIDDLITKETEEPYRMFTSLAEYRLLLRYDNAHHRLLSHAEEIGILDKKTLEMFFESKEKTQLLYKTFKKKHFQTNENPTSKKLTLDQAIKQKILTEENLPEFKKTSFSEYTNDAVLQAFVLSQYDGYIKRQDALIQKTKKLENLNIPQKIDFTTIPSLSNEGREKLIKYQPKTLGNASRIRGISPADLQILLLYINQVSRGT